MTSTKFQISSAHFACFAHCGSPPAWQWLFRLWRLFLFAFGFKKSFSLQDLHFLPFSFGPNEDGYLFLVLQVAHRLEPMECCQATVQLLNPLSDCHLICGMTRDFARTHPKLNESTSLGSIPLFRAQMVLALTRD